MSNDKKNISLKEVEDIAQACLVANGCNDENAKAVSTTIMAAERDGCPGHGLFRLPGYVAALKSGKLMETLHQLSREFCQACCVLMPKMALRRYLCLLAASILSRRRASKVW